jgi:hypothetical protein
MSSFTINDDVTLTSSASIDNVRISGNTISSTDTDGHIVLAPNGNGTVQTDNLQLDGNTISSTDTDGDLLLLPNGTGNVGIGTSSPRKRLQVNSPADSFYSNTSGQSVEIFGSASATPPEYSVVGSTATVMINSTDAYAQNVGASISLGGRSYAWGGSDEPHTVYTRISGVQQPGTDQYYGNFVVETLYQNSGGLKEALRIDGNGNVGIGTTSPSAMLDIGGNTDGSVQAILTRGNDADFQLQTINQSSSNASGAIVSKFGVRHGTNETALFNFIRGNLSNDGSIAIITNNSERMRINSAGNVGIGTTSPSSLLHVAGDFKCARFFTGDYGYWKRIYVDGTTAAGEARLYFINASNLNTYLHATGFTTFSDDRLKEEEELVINGLDICRKLRPQTYMKKNTFTSTDRSLWKKETGFIAQEVYYDIPELRHLVSTGHNNDNIPDNITTSTDPTVDPDYSSWGSNEASLHYNEFIPYTVSAIQEVDRRQVTDNERILELENENAALQSEVNTLKQQMALVMQNLGL